MLIYPLIAKFYNNVYYKISSVQICKKIYIYSYKKNDVKYLTYSL